MFEEKLSDTGEKLENPLNCPLLSLSKILIVILTTSVLSLAFVIHECTSTCTFRRQPVKRRMEQEEVDIDSLQYIHDNRNNAYAFNIYYMKCCSMSV